MITTEQLEKQDMKRKRVAFTFDDGPNEEFTIPLLDALKQRNVVATFFLIGENVAKNAHIVKRMHNEGHQIANHSWDHKDLRSLSEDEVIKQVQQTNDAIYVITKEKPEYIRPPYGNTTEVITKKCHLKQVTWDIDTRDWDIQNKDEIVKIVLSEIDTDQIVLMHDSYTSTIEAAIYLIDELKEKGYEFITVKELI